MHAKSINLVRQPILALPSGVHDHLASIALAMKLENFLMPSVYNQDFLVFQKSHVHVCATHVIFVRLYT